MYHAFRLTENQDLKGELMQYAREHHLSSAVILSAVGCIKHLHIRLAEAIDEIDIDGNYEIVSITGTLNQDDCHIHISVSDNKGQTIGGHLKNGTLIHTTSEIVLLSMDEFTFKREFDHHTGYNELVVVNNKDNNV